MQIPQNVINAIGKFLAEDPPVIHNGAYGKPCSRTCKACRYEKLRKRALNSFFHLRKLGVTDESKD